MSHSTSILGSFGGQLLLGIAFLSSLASGVYLARTYRVVTSRYLAGFLATISLIPLADFVDHEIDPQHAPLILDIIDALTFPFAMAVGLVGGMLFWLAFVLTYTSGIRGREMRYFRVGAPVTVIVTFGALIPQHIQEAGLAQFGGWAEPIGSLGVLLAVGLIFGSIGYGAIQLFRTGRTHYASTLREMTLLTLSGIWLFFSLIVLPFLEIPDVEATGIGIFGTLGIIGIAVGHFDVLGETPATQVVGRDTAVENIESGIVVLNPQGRIIDANEAAELLFEHSADELVGQTLDDVLPDSVESESVETLGESDFEIPGDNRVIRAYTTTATDDSGRNLGRTIVFHDITDERQRQQRIQVLNRVLRHNLRNDLNAVNGYAELLEQQTSDPDNYLLQIQEMADELISVGEKAREIEEVVASEREARTGLLVDVIKQAVEETRSGSEECEIHVESPAENPEVNSVVLTSILRELIENGCQHNDADAPVVEVDTTVDEDDRYPITVTVSDNGPGIPKHELTPLQEGAETALEHGSGLGLWLVEWGVSKLNGEIEFAPNEPRGTVVTLRLPILTEPV